MSSPAPSSSRPSSSNRGESLVGVGSGGLGPRRTGAMAAIQLDPSDATLAPRVAWRFQGRRHNSSDRRQRAPDLAAADLQPGTC